MMFAKLPKIFAVVKRLLNESVNAYFPVFMNEIFHLLIHKYIYKPIHHIQTPNMNQTFTYKTVW